MCGLIYFLVIKIQLLSSFVAPYVVDAGPTVELQRHVIQDTLSKWKNALWYMLLVKTLLSHIRRNIEQRIEGK